ncbi:MAG: phospholipase D family protein [Candidatus ainarchaeum sp.]|nr:phospholipase D family protein [Candidatus ainarchaeum sp.]
MINNLDFNVLFQQNEKKLYFILCLILIGFFLTYCFNYYSIFGFAFENKPVIENESFCSENINVYFCPLDDCSSKIVDLINSSTNSIDIAIYSFTYLDIANALIKAKERGVIIRVLFDKIQSSSNYSLDELLQQNNIFVKISTNPSSMHNKFMIVDNKIISTGSFNYTTNATKNNNENLLIIADKEIANKYALEFDRLFILN